MNILRLSAILLSLVVSSAQAAPVFDSAKITFIQHDVAVADLKVSETTPEGTLKSIPATLNQTLSSNNSMITGQKSRAELQFNDGTLTRIGQLTSYSFKQGTRDISIKQGSALFVVPKGMGGTKIQAGPVTAAITGTTLVVQVFSNRVLVYVYEGSVTVGDQVIRAGQVYSIPETGAGMPTLMAFDIDKAISTGALFTKFIDAPSQREVIKAIKAVFDEVPHPSQINEVIDNTINSPVPAPELRPLGEQVLSPGFSINDNPL
jgi:hypothetical protein